MNDRQKEGSNTKSEVYRSVSVWWTCNTPPPSPGLTTPTTPKHPLSNYPAYKVRSRHKKNCSAVWKNTRKKDDKYV